jgi:DnaJ-domain-containing protein 1
MQLEHYATLGLCQTADSVVIKAAYRALAKIYHPDRCDGSAEGANRKMAAINDAYAILGDPESRAEYDASYQGDTRSQEGAQAERDQANGLSDWEVAAKYFPELVWLCDGLRLVEPSLAHALQATLLKNRRFDTAETVAVKMVRERLSEQYNKHFLFSALALALKLRGNHAESDRLVRAIRITGSAEKVYAKERDSIHEALGIEFSSGHWQFQGESFPNATRAALASAKSLFDPPEDFPQWLYQSVN